MLRGFAPVDASDDCSVTGISLDSRTVQPGGLFLAVAGISSHGLDYVDTALQKGARAVAYEPRGDADRKLLEQVSRIPSWVAVPGLSQCAGEIASRFYGVPSAGLFTVGITGTNGKTSVASFVAQLSERLGQRCGIMGTLGNGFEGALDQSTHTTADAVTVQQTLATLRDAGAVAVAMEVSSHALSQARVGGVGFDVAVFTNLSRDHLDYHGTMQAYAEAKRSLLEVPGLTTAVVNMDDAEGQNWLASAPGQLSLLSYSMADNCADLYLSSVSLSLSGLEASLHYKGESISLKAPLIGQFNLSNILAAAAVMLARGFDMARIVECLPLLKPAPGRMQLLPSVTAGQPAVVVDYAHTPDALEQALAALRPHCAGTLHCVFGCGGNRDKGKRPMMAAIAEKLADRVIVTDDNPRTESPERIVADILRGVDAADNITVEHDRAAAIAKALSEAGEDDCVLIAGKGHESYQLVGDQCHDFDDAEVAMAWLREHAS
ncbi:MAG: UDP-N-acetylmuramoyl-L-alanyl-D-glutamate--2,6-diaminopimelate ligase [bacterium]